MKAVKSFTGPLMKLIRMTSLSAVACIIVIFMVARTDMQYKFWKQPNRIIAWDVIGYYQYLPMTFIYKDISGRFIQEGKKDFSKKIWLDQTENKMYVGRMTMGVAILYSPFFAGAHWLAGPLGYEKDGYTIPYSFAIIVASLFYLAAGLFLLRKFLLKYFPELPVALTLLAIGLATNLFFYSTIEPGMSHAFSFFLFAAFLLLADRWLGSPGIGRSVLLGLVSGMIILIRPTNGIVILFLLLWQVGSMADLRERARFLARHIVPAIIIALSAFIVLLPQAFYWKYVTGSYVFNSYGDQYRFYFGRPRFIEGLFSYRKGWLLYTPVMGLALLGLIVPGFRKSKMLPAVLIFILINLYLVFSWWCWWYGGSFGMRALIESYVIMALPLAALISWTMDRRVLFKGLLVLVLGFFIYLNIFQTRQYYRGAIHWDSMSREAYWDSFLRKRPSAAFQQLLKHPDYAKALQGIDAVKETTPPQQDKEATQSPNK